MVLHLVFQQWLAAQIEVARDHGKGHHVDEVGQFRRAIVKLVVAHGHRVIAHLLHELSFSRTFVSSVEQRTLERVTSIQNHDVLVAEARFFAVDGRFHARHTAKAFAFSLVFGVAG